MCLSGRVITLVDMVVVSNLLLRRGDAPNEEEEEEEELAASSSLLSASESECSSSDGVLFVFSFHSSLVTVGSNETVSKAVSSVVRETDDPSVEEGDVCISASD